MTKQTIKISEVVYNAGTQCFEAMVSVGTGDKMITIPCAIEAPITMSFEQASKGLVTQALRRYKSRTGMYSQMRSHVASVRAGRPRFDPRAWLAQLGLGTLDEAA